MRWGIHPRPQLGKNEGLWRIRTKCGQKKKERPSHGRSKCRPGIATETEKKPTGTRKVKIQRKGSRKYKILTGRLRARGILE